MGSFPRLSLLATVNPSVLAFRKDGKSIRARTLWTEFDTCCHGGSWTNSLNQQPQQPWCPLASFGTACPLAVARYQEGPRFQNTCLSGSTPVLDYRWHLLSPLPILTCPPMSDINAAPSVKPFSISPSTISTAQLLFRIQYLPWAPSLCCTRLTVLLLWVCASVFPLVWEGGQ